MNVHIRNAARWPVMLMLAGCAAAWSPLVQAQAGPQQSAKPLPGASARVVVRFKTPLAGATRTIQSAAGADLAAAQVSQALGLRASGLSQRLGLPLRAGRAVDERTQVLVADGADATRLLQRLRADPEVEFAAVDGRRRIAAVPNDPLYAPSPAPANGPASGQWYLKPPQAGRLVNGNEVLASIDAQTAWDITTGSPNVVVAVLDTGVRPDHPDLAGKLLPGYDMIADTLPSSPDRLAMANDGDGRDADASDPGDWIDAADTAGSTFEGCQETGSSWHGTQVSGLIAAATHNGSGIAGVGWNTRVLPVRVLGKCFGYDSDIVAGMRWAAGLHVPGVPDNPVANRARVLNLSLGDTADTVTPCSQTLYAAAMSEMAAADAVVVVAAGNGTGRAVQPPGNCPNVITVAGVRHIGTKVGYSNIGPQATVAAPAGNCVNDPVDAQHPCLYPVLSTTNAGTTTPAGFAYSDGQNYSVGTSFSAPLVAGTAALMLAANPALTAAQVKAILQNTARAFPFRGSPADSLGAVPQCRAPDASDQVQCYCTTSTCGAGLLDASWAVHTAAFNAPQPSIAAGTAVAGQSLTLTADGNGRPLQSWQWSLIDGGGIVSALSGNASSVIVTPSAAGRFSVRLLTADQAGTQGVREQTIEVAATAPAAADSGGGGALSVGWLAGLALAVVALSSSSPRRRA